MSMAELTEVEAATTNHRGICSEKRRPAVTAYPSSDAACPIPAASITTANAGA
jgi:hypothetical protein